jgi:hypothetical protein
VGEDCGTGVVVGVGVCPGLESEAVAINAKIIRKVFFIASDSTGK